jgi:hypothetical protein
MGLAPDKVAGYFPLGQKSVGGNVLAGNIKGVKERDGSGYLVRLFHVVTYRKAAHFFWV